MSDKGDSATSGPRLPAEAAEFCRLIAKILRRRTGDKGSAEAQRQDATPGVAPIEHRDVEDKPEEEQG